jgi:hypothetical protein
LLRLVQQLTKDRNPAKGLALGAQLMRSRKGPNMYKVIENVEDFLVINNFANEVSERMSNADDNLFGKFDLWFNFVKESFDPITKETVTWATEAVFSDGSDYELHLNCAFKTLFVKVLKDRKEIASMQLQGLTEEGAIVPVMEFFRSTLRNKFIAKELIF